MSKATSDKRSASLRGVEDRWVNAVVEFTFALTVSPDAPEHKKMAAVDVVFDWMLDNLPEGPDEPQFVAWARWTDTSDADDPETPAERSGAANPDVAALRSLITTWRGEAAHNYNLAAHAAAKGKRSCRNQYATALENAANALEELIEEGRQNEE